MLVWKTRGRSLAQGSTRLVRATGGDIKKGFFVGRSPPQNDKKERAEW